MKKPNNKYYGMKYQLPVIIGAVVALVLTIVGVVILTGGEPTYAIVGFVMAAVGVVGFAVVGFVEKSFIDKSRRICDKCGASMEGCAYEYQEKSRKYVTGSGNSSGHLEVTVWIRATCPQCGAIKEFTRSFKVDNHSDNLQFQVDNFCRKAFGH